MADALTLAIEALKDVLGRSGAYEAHDMVREALANIEKAEPTKVWAVEILDGAEYDSWVVESIWDSKEKAEKYAKRQFIQSNWGSPVPKWNIQEYELNKP